VGKGNTQRNQFVGGNQGFFFLLIYEQNAKFKKEEKGSDFGGSQSLQLRGET
jgi:hypothetical protein